MQYEPCNKVGSGEAQAREQVLPVSERVVHAARPAGFENAARQEHHNEAAALRNLHEQAVRATCESLDACEGLVPFKAASLSTAVVSLGHVNWGLRHAEVAQVHEVDDTDVSPELDWCEPPLCVLWEYSQDNPQLRVARPQPGDMFACGESSQERQEREAYRHLHPHKDFGPGATAVLSKPQLSAALGLVTSSLMCR